jgi:hypothetical protein
LAAIDSRVSTGLWHAIEISKVSPAGRVRDAMFKAIAPETFYRWMLQRVQKACEADIAAARAEGADEDTIDGLHADLEAAIAQARGAHRAWRTTVLVGKAQRFDVTVPAAQIDGRFNDEAWINRGGNRYLTEEVFAKVRAAVRVEEKILRDDLRDWAEVWGKFTVPLIGVLGAVTGVIAVLGR